MLLEQEISRNLPLLLKGKKLLSSNVVLHLQYEACQMKDRQKLGNGHKYGVFSGPYFAVFGLNTEIY